MKKINMFSNMDKGVLTASDMKQTKYKILYFVLTLIMLIYLAVIIVPCLWLLVSGFKDVSEMYARPVKFFPEHFSFSKIAKAWTQMKYYKYYINTTVMALGCVVSDVVISGLAGYVLSRLKPRGYKLVLALVFCMMLLPSTMSTVPLYMTFKKFPYLNVSLLNTYLPMWLLSAANMFDIILFKTNFDGVSQSLVEAAKIDGASDIKIFTKIIIPLSIPVIMTVALFAFNTQFGNFFWPYLVISDKAKFTLGIQVYMMKSSSLTMDYQMIGILFSILPQLVIFALFQKHIIGGMNLGGVKG